MTIHVLHLITGLGVGGAEHMLEKLVTGMNRPDFRNTVVSLTRDDQIGERLRQAGIPLYHFNMTHPLSLPRTVLQLRRLLMELQPDIIQTWLYHADLVGTLAHMITPIKAKLLWNLRCSDMDMSRYSAATRWVLRFLPPLSRRPRIIISNSEAGRLHHVGLGYREEDWVMLPNGFDLTIFRPDEQARLRLRKQLGLTEQDYLVGMIARRDPMKDHDNFLAMVRQITRQRSNVHFLLVGRGCEPDTAWGSRVLADSGARLHLLGEQKDIASLLPGIDIMALTSAYGEGFPNVLGEALATGLPCVATDVGDAALILDRCGIIVPPRNPDALVAGILRILDMPAAERAAWQQKMRQRADAEFNLVNITARYEALYRSVVGIDHAAAAALPQGLSNR